MARLRVLRTVVATTLAALLSLGTAVAGNARAQAAVPAADAPKPASLTTLKAQALVFQQAAGKTAQRDIAVGSMAATSAFEAKLWKDFVGAWSTINAGMKMNTSIPSGLPAKGHVFVVLGSALSKSGKLTTKLERRLKLALQALKKYPNSKVLVSGGAPRKGKTEAKVMKSWLVSKGVASARIISETTSASVIGNAKYSMEVLAKHPEFTTYTLVSDASQLRLASVLYRAGSLRMQELSGKPWALTPVSNVAYRDMKTAGKGPLRASSVTNAANYVASLLGLSTQYKKVLASPPKAPVLTSLVVTPPSKATYSVGTRLSVTGVAAKALYNKGVYSRPVTGLALTGFSSKEAGRRTAKVSYTERGVTKSASFGYTIVKASSKLSVKLSTTKVKRSKTRVTATVRITTGSSGVVPTGKVTFYLDGKRLKTTTLKAASSGAVTFKYPKVTKAGKHSLVVKYAGTSKLTSAKKTVKVQVTR